MVLYLVLNVAEDLEREDILAGVVLDEDVGCFCRQLGEDAHYGRGEGRGCNIHRRMWWRCCIWREGPLLRVVNQVNIE